jgi:uncharacterized protein Yka (UPF0111/DUF47 family)
MEAVQEQFRDTVISDNPAVGDVAELIDRLEGWLDYRPMQEFCSEALKDLREAASRLAALQQRVEELERQRDQAIETAMQLQDAAARERVDTPGAREMKLVK